MKNYHYLLLLLGGILLGGGVRTARVAYDINSCIGCSAPWWIALIFPGGLYFSLLIVGAIIYFFMKKKVFFARSLFVLFIMGIIFLAWNIKNSSNHPLNEGNEILLTGDSTLIPLPAISELPHQNFTTLIEVYLQNMNNATLRYPRLQETWFCGYEEFDREQKENQIFSYGWQLCESFFIKEKEITCPNNPEIEKTCFGDGDCSQCVVEKIPKQLVRGSGVSYPMRFVVENGKVIEERIPEDGGPDENGEGGYYNSTKSAFSQKAFKKFKSYNLTPELQNKVLKKAQTHF